MRKGGGQIDPTQRKLFSKSPALLGLTLLNVEETIVYIKTSTKLHHKKIMLIKKYELALHGFLYESQYSNVRFVNLT